MLSQKYAILFTNTDYSALRPLQEKKLFLSCGSFTWELDFCKETDIDQQRQRKSIDRHNLFFLGEKNFTSSVLWSRKRQNRDSLTFVVLKSSFLFLFFLKYLLLWSLDLWPSSNLLQIYIVGVLRKSWLPLPPVYNTSWAFSEYMIG